MEGASRESNAWAAAAKSRKMTLGELPRACGGGLLEEVRLGLTSRFSRCSWR